MKNKVFGNHYISDKSISIFRRIDRAIKRKRLAIKRREERREVIVRKNRREKDPLRRRINLNLIQIIEDEINRFLSEVQKCEERMDEITPVSEEK